MIKSYQKDPAATLDYTIDWATWLETGDTITAHTFTAPAGLVKESDSHTDTAATVWISGGTAGTAYDVTCQITTAGGRIDERTITIGVQNR